MKIAIPYMPVDRASPRVRIERLATDGILPRKKIEYWNDIACKTFTAQTVEPLGPTFSAAMVRTEMGDIRMVEAISERSIVTHSRAQVALSTEAFFLLHLHLAGESVNRQDGREIRLRPGDFTMVDSSRPYQLAFSQTTSILVLRIPRPILRRYIACPEVLTLLPMAGNKGASGLASRFIQDVWRCVQSGTLGAPGSRLSGPILDLLANAYAEMPAAHVQGSSLTGTLRVQIRNYIEGNLDDADLTPSSIADAFGISARYLHMVFRGEPDTVARYIQRRRVEESARALADPMRRTLSITAIATAHGFKSQAHFSRVFRESYGVAPSDFRQQNTPGAARIALI
jgi:AraC-like DNA-binding protein